MKRIKTCPQCSQLASERDQLLVFKELYEKTKQQKEVLQASLERVWKLIDQLTPSKEYEKN